MLNNDKQDQTYNQLQKLYHVANNRCSDNEEQE